MPRVIQIYIQSRHGAISTSKKTQRDPVSTHLPLPSSPIPPKQKKKNKHPSSPPSLPPTAAAPRNSRIINQHIQPRNQPVGNQRLDFPLRILDTIPIRDVETQGCQAALGEIRDLRGAARAGEDGVAAGVEVEGERVSDAAVGAAGGWGWVSGLWFVRGRGRGGEKRGGAPGDEHGFLGHGGVGLDEQQNGGRRRGRGRNDE
ncbi:hypothetical protein DSL72_000405 [Monilinia vaccinii-corymbosi]|uniref:Uncharacterized protein n=1 Tax=Monilinia vaccinii-corymbosi TaxID=61207 RepID=A0A8A3PAB3_9HELO|nr:hypothetical protein DSL72_000405 [Monilinia vaccinii-corymbosi]